MSTTGMVPPGGTPGQVQAAMMQQLQAQHRLNGSSGWFLWIGILSVVNSVTVLAGAGFHFILGLGITQVVDAFSRGVGAAGLVLDLIINGGIVGIFILFWYFAKKGQRWAFIVGMALYALDGILLVYFQDFLSAAFHGYVLFRLFQGFAAITELEASQQALALAGGPIGPT